MHRTLHIPSHNKYQTLVLHIFIFLNYTACKSQEEIRQTSIDYYYRYLLQSTTTMIMLVSNTNKTNSRFLQLSEHF